MLTACTWLWHQPGYRKKFGARHVNTLRNMVERNLSLPHEFVCVTNMPEGVDPRIRIVPLPKVPAPPWSEFKPNCFKRLWAFSEEAREKLGDRIASFDLDCVVVGSLDKLLDRKEDFVIWRDALIPGQYNGGFWLLKAGSRSQVWKDWRGQTIRGARGSDQGWISAKLKGEATWSETDGVLSYRKHVQKRGLPKGARIVFFHGKPDPWEAKDPWIKDHYR